MSSSELSNVGATGKPLDCVIGVYTIIPYSMYCQVCVVLVYVVYSGISVITSVSYQFTRVVVLLEYFL